MSVSHGALGQGTTPSGKGAHTKRRNRDGRLWSVPFLLQGFLIISVGNQLILKTIPNKTMCSPREVDIMVQIWLSFQTSNPTCSPRQVDCVVQIWLSIEWNMIRLGSQAHEIVTPRGGGGEK